MNYNKIVWLVWMIALIQISLALKPAPASFYGYIAVKDNYAPQGTLVEVYDSDMTSCGSFVVKQEGGYGLLLCIGDDPDTPEDEGAIHGDTLTFYINGFKAQTKEQIVWQSGVLKHVNLFLGEIREIEPFQESPVEIKISHIKDIIIKIVSIVGSIVLIIIFLWYYNKK